MKLKLWIKIVLVFIVLAFYGGVTIIIALAAKKPRLQITYILNNGPDVFIWGQSGELTCFPDEFVGFGWPSYQTLEVWCHHDDLNIIYRYIQSPEMRRPQIELVTDNFYSLLDPKHLEFVNSRSNTDIIEACHFGTPIGLIVGEPKAKSYLGELLCLDQGIVSDNYSYVLTTDFELNPNQETRSGE